MRIVIAPDSFKGSLDALEAARCIAAGIEAAGVRAELMLQPLSDGGEGCAAILGGAAGAEQRICRARDWAGRPLDAAYWIASSTDKIPANAYLDAATVLAANLHEPDGASVLHRSSRAFGRLLQTVIETGAGTVYAGLGGTFTNDAGIGMAAALGYRFFDSRGRQIEIGETVSDPLHEVLIAVKHIEKPREDGIGNTRVINALCDVINPLCGPMGATRVYGPQKGVDAGDLERLDDAIACFAACVQRDVADVDTNLPGCGAAGGLGFALAAFTGATLRRGAEAVLRTLAFHEVLRNADLVVTGEGCIDEQSAMGKVVGEVARAARAASVTCIACAGTLRGNRDELLAKLGLHTLVSVIDTVPTADDFRNAADRLTLRIEKLFREGF